MFWFMFVEELYINKIILFAQFDLNLKFTEKNG